MRRSTLNFVVDLVSLLVMLSMMATGLLMRFILPPGTGGRHGGEAGKALWGLGRHDWGDVHFWLAVTLGVLILIHVALHWTWVCATVRRFVRGGETESAETSIAARTSYGIGFLVVVVSGLAVFLWIASVNVTAGGGADGEGGGYRYRGGAGPAGASQDEPDADVEEAAGQEAEQDEQAHGAGWGVKTLAEIEAETGVPAAVIREKLGLPETVATDERLGRLRQRYGFRMSVMHDIITEYQAKPGRQPADK